MKVEYYHRPESRRLCVVEPVKYDDLAEAVREYNRWAGPERELRLRLEETAG